MSKESFPQNNDKPELHPDQLIESQDHENLAGQSDEDIYTDKKIYELPDGSLTMPLTLEEYKDARDSFIDNQK